MEYQVRRVNRCGPGYEASSELLVVGAKYGSATSRRGGGTAGKGTVHDTLLGPVCHPSWLNLSSENETRGKSMTYGIPVSS